MKKIPILVALLTLALCLPYAPTAASAGTPDGGLEALASPSAPPLPAAAGRQLCLVDDNFDGASSNPGTWTLSAGGGTISGNAVYDTLSTTCSYSVTGTYQGANVEMDLIQTSSGCCDSGVATGTVNRAQRQIVGQITWYCAWGNSVGDTTWTLCPR